MFKSAIALLFVAVTSCAHGKLENVRLDLAGNSFQRSDPLFVEAPDTTKMDFSGDKAGSTGVNNSEKRTLETELTHKIKERLSKAGFQLAEQPGGAVIISTTITHYDRGSGSTRAWVGMGAGSATLFSNVQIKQQEQTIGEFEVAATSGGRGGLTSGGSFLHGHMDDTAEIITEFISERIRQ